MRLLFILFAVITFIFLYSSCHEQTTAPAHGKLELIAEDIGVKDAVVRIKATVSHGPWTLTITKDSCIAILPERIKYASFEIAVSLSERLKNIHRQGKSVPARFRMKVAGVIRELIDFAQAPPKCA